MEGENMLFVKASAPSLIVPTVYAIFSRVQEEDKENSKDPITINYIIMEYIPGRTLESCWGRMDDATKTKVVAKLRDYFSQLRQIPSPRYFGALGKRPFCDDGFVWHREDDELQQPHLSSGPFDSEEQLLDALIAKYEFHSGSRLHGDRRHEYYRYVLPQVLRSGGSVFTHGDLQRKNVIVREDNGEVVIIDWESAGWYPGWWEFYSTMFCCRWKDDWHLWVGRILDEYPNQYAWMMMIFR
ncbi:kinase-like domain-containing protein [Apiospora hydei]|uniref:Kinase-like domain-containing protein n=1 Tax=Apiospora hydei TaxID=1337664 RepID=A0ABR1VW88_9PEZI